MFYFSEEHSSSAAFRCVTCDKKIGTWRNFKRHNEEVHGVQGRYICDECEFKTNRKETLDRHRKAYHCGPDIVSCIIWEIIDKLPDCPVQYHEISNDSYSSDPNLNSDSQEDEPRSSPSSEDEDTSNPLIDALPISEYEKIKNANVAECKAMFAMIFADEISEIDQRLNLPKSKKKRLPKKVPEGPIRKSSRLLAKTSGGRDDETAAMTVEDEMVADSVCENSPSAQSSIEVDATSVLGEESGSNDMENVHTIDVNSDSSVGVVDLGRFGCLVCVKSFRYYYCWKLRFS